MGCSALLRLLQILLLLTAHRVAASAPCLWEGGSPGKVMCVLFSNSNLTCHWHAQLNSSTPIAYKINWRLYQEQDNKEATMSPMDVDPSWDQFNMYSIDDNQLLRSTCDDHDGCVVCELRAFHIFLGNFIMYEVWVTTNSTAESEHLHFEPRNKILLSPPSKVQLHSEATETTQLTVTWMNPPESPSCTCQLRYRHSKTDNWTMVNQIMENASQYTLYELEPGSLYSAQLRCRKTPKGEYWSPWSKLQDGKTPDAVPLGVPDVWRELGEPDARGLRDLTVLWKNLPEKQARGRVQGWLVSLDRRPAVTLEASCRGATVAVPASDHVLVSVRATNSAGSSGTARISVSGINHPGAPPPTKLSTNSQEGPDGRPEIRVTWAAPTHRSHLVKEYLVEWSPTSDSTSSSTSAATPPPFSPPSSLVLPSPSSSSTAAAAAAFVPSSSKATSWRPLLKPSLKNWVWLPATHVSFNITENVEPCVAHEVSVYALIGQREGPPARTIAYARECPPARGLELSILDVQGNSALLVWKEIPLKERRGVIQGYTIYYGDSSGFNKTEKVNASQTRLLLPHLQSATKYTAVARARTAAGAGPLGPSFHFKTKHLDDWKMVAIVTTVCMALLLLVVATSCLCSRCKSWIKEHLYYPDFMKSRVFRDIMQQQQSPGGQRQSSSSDLETVVSSVEVVESNSPLVLHGSCKGGDAPTATDARSLGGETSGIGSSRPSSPDRQTSDESDTCCSSNATSVANVDALLPPVRRRRREGPGDGSEDGSGEEDEDQDERAVPRSHSHQALDELGEGCRASPGTACPRAHTWSCSDGEEPCLLSAPRATHAEPYSQVSYRDRRERDAPACPGCVGWEVGERTGGGDDDDTSRPLDAVGDGDDDDDGNNDSGSRGGSFTDASMLLRSFMGKPCLTDGECRCCGRSKPGSKSGGVSGGGSARGEETSVEADGRVQAYFPQLVTEAGYMPQ